MHTSFSKRFDRFNNWLNFHTKFLLGHQAFTDDSAASAVIYVMDFTNFTAFNDSRLAEGKKKESVPFLSGGFSFSERDQYLLASCEKLVRCHKRSSSNAFLFLFFFFQKPSTTILTILPILQIFTLLSSSVLKSITALKSVKSVKSVKLQRFLKKNKKRERFCWETLILLRKGEHLDFQC